MLNNNFFLHWQHFFNKYPLESITVLPDKNNATWRMTSINFHRPICYY